MQSAESGRNSPLSPAIEVSSAVKPAALAADEPPPLPAAPCRRPSIRTPRVRVQVIPPLAPLLFFFLPRDLLRVQMEVLLRDLMRIGGIALMASAYRVVAIGFPDLSGLFRESGSRAHGYCWRPHARTRCGC